MWVICFLVVVELVKLIFVICGWVVSVVLQLVLLLVIMLNILLGMFVWVVSFVICSRVSGVVFEGLMMIEQFVVRVGMIFYMLIISGKFYGMMFVIILIGFFLVYVW